MMITQVKVNPVRIVREHPLDLPSEPRKRYTRYGKEIMSTSLMSVSPVIDHPPEKHEIPKTESKDESLPSLDITPLSTPPVLPQEKVHEEQLTPGDDGPPRFILASALVRHSPVTQSPRGQRMESFSIGKHGSQCVLPNLPQVLVGWTEDGNGMNGHEMFSLTSGRFAFSRGGILALTSVSVSWKNDKSNVGHRILRIRKSSQDCPQKTVIIGEVKESADINREMPTVQSISRHIRLERGDIVWFEVEHNAPCPVIVSDVGTHVCGFII